MGGGALVGQLALANGMVDVAQVVAGPALGTGLGEGERQGMGPVPRD